MSTDLSAIVERVARALAPLDAATLEADWPEDAAGSDRWAAYFYDSRGVAFAAYQELRELAVDLAAERAVRQPLTSAQRILGQHQLAWRDLTGALTGVRDDELDRSPAPDEWPLRAVLEHMLRAEVGFSLVIESALAQRGAAELRPAQFGAEEAFARSEGMLDLRGDLATLLANAAHVHAGVQARLVGLADDDLELPTLWWEGRVTPLRFRLQRMDAHLREHTIQVDKTLLGIGHQPTEGARLARLLHRALGECEAALLGADDIGAERIAATAAQLDAWCGQLAAVG